MILFSQLSPTGQPRSFKLGLSQLPAVIGSGEASAVQLQDSGVWDRHAEIRIAECDGIHVVACGEGSVLLNGTSVPSARLGNGDVVHFGSVAFRFGFEETKQYTFHLREWLSWSAIAVLCLLQLWLVYFLLP